MKCDRCGAPVIECETEEGVKVYMDARADVFIQAQTLRDGVLIVRPLAGDGIPCQAAPYHGRHGGLCVRHDGICPVRAFDRVEAPPTSEAQ